MKNENFDFPLTVLESFDFHWLFQRFFSIFFDLGKYFRFCLLKWFNNKSMTIIQLKLPILTPEFPKIPKIALRKLCARSERLYQISYFIFPDWHTEAWHLVRSSDVHVPARLKLTFSCISAEPIRLLVRIAPRSVAELGWRKPRGCTP